MHLVAPGIQSLRNPLDIAALSSRVPSLISYDHRDLLAVQPVMQFPKMLLQSVQFLFIPDWGAVVIKFWVQIDKDTQLQRFELRQNTPVTIGGRFTPKEGRIVGYAPVT